MKNCIVCALILHALPCVFSQPAANRSRHQLAVIAFWNVENLFDTVNDRFRQDDEFTPAGANRWNEERYRKKIHNLAATIAGIGTDATPAGPALIGLCEVENAAVLGDLVASPVLKERNYRYVHIEGPDLRGIDPALIYNPAYFTVEKSIAYRVQLVTDSLHRTRDILVVSGKFGGERVAVLVNHWPSRRGGELASRPNRTAAAIRARKIVDSLAAIQPPLKILLMGDFNDDPVNESIRTHLRANGETPTPGSNALYNPMEALYRKGIGTLAWQDSWNIFDQVILDGSWCHSGFESWQFLHARVFNRQFLRSDHGNFRGYPFRTFSGGIYTGGYSDHFPVYITVARKLN